MGLTHVRTQAVLTAIQRDRLDAGLETLDGAAPAADDEAYEGTEVELERRLKVTDDLIDEGSRRPEAIEVSVHLGGLSPIHRSPNGAEIRLASSWLCRSKRSGYYQHDIGLLVQFADRYTRISHTASVCAIIEQSTTGRGRFDEPACNSAGSLERPTRPPRYPAWNEERRSFRSQSYPCSAPGAFQ